MRLLKRINNNNNNSIMVKSSLWKISHLIEITSELSVFDTLPHRTWPQHLEDLSRDIGFLHVIPSTGAVHT